MTLATFTEPAATRREPRTITDCDRFVSLFPVWHGRFEQVTRGRFVGTVQTVRGRQSYAHVATTNQAVRIRGRETVGVLSVGLVVAENTGCLWQGRRLDAGCLVIRGGDVPADHVTSRRAMNITFSCGEDRFRRAMQCETGADPGPFDWRVVQTSPECFRKLLAAIRQFVASGSDGGGYAVEAACLTATVDALTPVNARRWGGPSAAARARLARRLDDVLRSQLRLPRTEAELCNELGVTGRTLRLACREHFGLGPLAYFQALRLNAARDALKSNEVSIAEVAREWGFHHLGKFAGYYRRMFGELPSATHRCASKIHFREESAKTAVMVNPAQVRSRFSTGCAKL